MRITLQVDGRELSLEEVEAIVREHFSKKEATEQKTTTKKEAKPIPRPTEGVPFDVNPLGIDRELFQKIREDVEQETTRLLILEAFDEVDAHHEKYGKSFWTLMPEKTWNQKTIIELREVAAMVGDHLANWVEQALEWAQRIQNGESWEAICNEYDTADCYRLVAWKDSCYRLVGGARRGNYAFSASFVGRNHYNMRYKFCHVVPLTVGY